MRHLLIILALVSITALPLLSSCDSSDLQEIINTAKLWAMVNDITDTDGNPNPGAIARFVAGDAFGFGTTGDDEGDAAIDSVKALNEIRQADDAAEEGWNQLYDGHNIQDAVLPHYNQAVGLRGNDWTYRNDRGIAYLEDIGNPNAQKLAKADFDKAAALAKATGRQADYLKMLKQREQSMARLVQHSRETNAYPTEYMLKEQSRTYDELYKLTGNNDYRLLKQQTDTNLAQGYYWRVDQAK